MNSAPPNSGHLADAAREETDRPDLTARQQSSCTLRGHVASRVAAQAVLLTRLSAL